MGTDPRQDQIAVEMEDFLTELGKRTGLRGRSLSEDAAGRQMFRSGLHYASHVKMWSETIREALEKRFSLERDIPGGPSPNLEQDVRDIFTMLIGEAEAALLQLSQTIGMERLHGPDFSAQKADITSWMERQVRIIRGRHTLGILYPPVQGTINVATMVVGTAHINVDHESLADMLTLVQERAVARGDAMADSIRELAEAVRAKKTPSTLDKLVDVVKASEKWAELAGTAWKIIGPALNAYMSNPS